MDDLHTDDGPSQVKVLCPENLSENLYKSKLYPMMAACNQGLSYSQGQCNTPCPKSYENSIIERVGSRELQQSPDTWHLADRMAKSQTVAFLDKRPRRVVAHWDYWLAA